MNTEPATPVPATLSLHIHRRERRLEGLIARVELPQVHFEVRSRQLSAVPADGRKDVGWLVGATLSG